jgi:hypothetical protein
MGYLWGIFDHKPQHGTVAYLPCASGCRGSDSDPRSCHCVCRGLNHGILVYPRPVQPVPVPQGYNPYLAMQQEPERLENKTPLLPHYRDRTETEKREAISKMPEVRAYHATGRLAKKIGRSLKVSLAGYSQDDLNMAVLNGLRKQFSQERADSFVTETFSEYFSHQPDANTPELYELYENGDLDRVLDRRSIRWVIGRPKIRR